jgi:hypothetical protein
VLLVYGKNAIKEKFNNIEQFKEISVALENLRQFTEKNKRIIIIHFNYIFKVNNIHTKKPSTIFTDNTRQNYKYEII